MNRNIIITIFILLSLLGVACYGDDNRISRQVEKYFDSYFDELEYTVLDSNLIIDGRKMVVALHLVEKDRIITNKAIVVEDGEVVIPHLFIEGKKIMNGIKEILFDATSYEYEFYGWGFKIDMPIEVSDNPGFYTEYYFNKQDVTDGITIEWDESSNSFIRWSLFD